MFDNTNLCQTFTECVSNQYAHCCIDMPDVTASYGTFWLMYKFCYVNMPDMTRGFHILLDVWNVKTSSNCYKLCVLEQDCRDDEYVSLSFKSSIFLRFSQCDNVLVISTIHCTLPPWCIVFDILSLSAFSHYIFCIFANEKE